MDNDKTGDGHYKKYPDSYRCSNQQQRNHYGSGDNNQGDW
jgi:hypothetical protein